MKWTEKFKMKINSNASVKIADSITKKGHSHKTWQTKFQVTQEWHKSSVTSKLTLVKPHNVSRVWLPRKRKMIHAMAVEEEMSTQCQPRRHQSAYDSVQAHYFTPGNDTAEFFELFTVGCVSTSLYVMVICFPHRSSRCIIVSWVILPLRLCHCH